MLQVLQQSRMAFTNWIYTLHNLGLPLLHDPDLLRKAFDEVPVVDDHQRGALEQGQRLLEARPRAGRPWLRCAPLAFLRLRMTV